MSRNIQPNPSNPNPLYMRPWFLLLVGLAIVAAGFVLSGAQGTAITTTRVILLAIGLLVAGAAVNRRLRTTGWELEQRIESAGLLAMAAFVALVAYGATSDDDWSSVRFFLTGIIIVALVGAFLVLLPKVPRMAAASLLILFHFTGIFVASMNAPPPNGQIPWLVELAYAYVYRPYLGYVYMTNAYHFFSPDPGSSNLLWMRIQYEDDSYRWVKLPSKKDSPVQLHYTHSLCIADSIGPNQAGQLSGPLLQLRYNDRRSAGNVFAGRPIPVVPLDLIDPLGNHADATRYQEPNEFAKTMISSYVRHVALNYPKESDPSMPIKNIKVYRITHKLLSPAELAEGYDPLSEAALDPFFMGEFNTKGELLKRQAQYDNNGRLILDDPKNPPPYDPFLYWAVPVVAVPIGGSSGENKTASQPTDFTIHNYIYVHAGDIKWFEDEKCGEALPKPEK